MKKSLLTIAAVATLALPGTSQALDLMQAYDLALTNDPSYRSATKEFEAGDANRIIGRSGLLPQLSANYSNANNTSKINQPNTGIYSQRYPSNNGTIQITQALINLQAWASAKQGYAQADVAKSKLVYNSQDLLIRTLQTYTEVLNYQDQIEYFTTQRNAYKEQLTINERRLKAGEGTVTDVLETKASYELSEVQLIEAKDNLANTKRKLEAMTGVTINSAADIKKLSKSFKVSNLPTQFDDWKESALSNNAEIQASKHSEEVAHQEYKKQLTNNAPTLNAVASWNQQNSAYTSTISQQSNTSMVGVQATWVLSNGGQTMGLMKQSYANWEKAQADTEVVQNRIVTELRKQYDAVVSSKQKVASLERAVESATELTKAMRKSVQAGERISVDVLLADKTRANAEKDLAQAKYAYLAAVLKLKQLAGNLNVQDLEQVATNFERDPNAPKVTTQAPQQLADNASVTVHELILPDLLVK
jgi:protease secretion system outer membrane protein